MRANRKPVATGGRPSDAVTRGSKRTPRSGSRAASLQPQTCGTRTAPHKHGSKPRTSDRYAVAAHEQAIAEGKVKRIPLFANIY